MKELGESVVCQQIGNACPTKCWLLPCALSTVMAGICPLKIQELLCKVAGVVVAYDGGNLLNLQIGSLK